MKKLFLFLVLFLTTSCYILPPTQLQPNFEKELIGLTDIPLTNMPGHAFPECPLECICPKWFGLPKSPCEPCYDKKTKTPEEVVWYNESNFFLAIKKAGDEGKMLLIVMVDKQDKLSIKLTKDLSDKLDSKCAQDELRNHYVPILVGRKGYQFLRKTSGKQLVWLPSDYVQTPAVMFVVVKKQGNTYSEHALPITFQGEFQGNICLTLRGFYEVSK